MVFLSSYIIYLYSTYQYAQGIESAWPWVYPPRIPWRLRTRPRWGPAAGRAAPAPPTSTGPACCLGGNLSISKQDLIITNIQMWRLKVLKYLIILFKLQNEDTNKKWRDGRIMKMMHNLIPILTELTVQKKPTNILILIYKYYLYLGFCCLQSILSALSSNRICWHRHHTHSSHNLDLKYCLFCFCLILEFHTGHRVEHSFWHSCECSWKESHL